MKYLDKAKGHFHTITAHKKTVMEYCFRVGLYRQGLLHDMSKYFPVEFLPGCIYYQGYRSPNNAEREANGVSRAWLHHKGRNKHHFEYWLDYSSDPSKRGMIVGNVMPTRYVIEMFLDRVAACRIYQGDQYSDNSPLEYYLRGVGRQDVLIHPLSAKLLKSLLVMLSLKGEAYTMNYVRNKLVPIMDKMDRRNKRIVCEEIASYGNQNCSK